jgi:hypothetical protein
MKHLVGRKITKQVDFLDEKVSIKKMSVAEILKLQTQAKENTDEVSSLKMIIRSGVEGAVDLSDEDIESFPIDELSKLASEVIEFSGINLNAVGTAAGN